MSIILVLVLLVGEQSVVGVPELNQKGRKYEQI